jgi:formate-dependent nitrite reductase membrane component NrfD
MAIKQDYKERAKPLVTKSRFYRILFSAVICSIVAVGIVSIHNYFGDATTELELSEQLNAMLWMVVVWIAGILMGLIIADGDPIS